MSDDDVSKFEGQNILQAKHNKNLVNSGSLHSITCPHCRTLGTFNNALDRLYSYAKTNDEGHNVGSLSAQLMICPSVSCSGLVFVIADQDRKILFTSPAELIDFDSSALPAKLLVTLKEAISCHAAGAYRACAMMIRRLLEEICEESNSTGKDLHARLEGLKEKITLPQELFDAMFELKALGNDAAHIKAKNYDNIGKEEAEDGIELAKEILKSLYQLKGLLERLKARKT